jgi:1-acyl-sn-glycerol-3-phosphate acyltransferase
MRTIMILLYLIIFAIISIPLFLIEFIIGKFNPHMKIKTSQSIVVSALSHILFLSGVKTTVIGLENVPKDEAVLYVANHRSYFDIVIGYTTVPTLTGFISKIEMEHIPCISHWMRNLQCLFLDRDNARNGLKTVLQGIEQIKNGYSIFIMPEGTRNQEKEMLPFHEGSFKFAEKSGCAIIPIAMNNADNILENHFPWIHKTHVIIEYGKPIYTNDLSKEEKKFLGVHVQKIISNTLEKNEPNV